MQEEVNVAPADQANELQHSGGQQERGAAYMSLFQAAEDKGYRVMVEHLRAGKHLAKQLNEMFGARASLEQECMVRLSKMAKGLVLTKEQEGSGTLGNIFHTVRQELETSARAHGEYAVLLRNTCEKPLTDMLARHKAVREGHLLAAEKNMKLRTTCQQNLVRVKDKYVTRCEELSSLRGAVDNKYGKDHEKAFMRLSKVESAVTALEAEFQYAKEQLEAADKAWEGDWARALREFETIDMERMQCMQMLLHHFCVASRDISKTDTECYERIRGKAETIDPTADLASFATQLSVACSQGQSGTPATVRTSLSSFRLSKKIASFLPTGSSLHLSSTDIGPSSTGTASRTPTNGEKGGDGYDRRPSPVGERPASATFDSNGERGASINPSAPPRTPDQFAVNIAGLGIDSPSGGVRIPERSSSAERRPPSAEASSESETHTVTARSNTPGAGAGAAANASSNKDDAAGDRGRARTRSEMSSSEVSVADYFDMTLSFPVVCRIRALFAYAARIEEELSLQVGQEMDVINRSPEGWWIAEATEADGSKRRGLIPSNFVQEIGGP